MRASVEVVGKVAGGQATVVVQYRDGERLRRVLVPREAIAGDHSACLDDLEAGVPASVAWAEHFALSFGGLDVERALQGLGIWTLADLRAHWPAAQKAIARLVIADIVAMLRRAGASEEA